MNISIEYCTEWNYQPRALRARDIVKERFKTNIDLVASSGGVFEITVDDKLVFSKKKEGRFPTDNELIELVRK